jgi:hypothetical protein
MRAGAATVMRMADFLKKGAQTRLGEVFIVAGAVCEIRTNSESILTAARECFPCPDAPQPVVDLHMRFWVDPDGTAQPPWPNPYFRGLGHLVFGGFDCQSSVLVDLASRRVIGRVSPALASDSGYWKTVIFPRLITAVGSAIGLTELHCGCVAWNGDGLVLWGPSGGGKSTLTLALACQGFSLLSEDWTYFSRRGEQVLAWGLPTGAKLLPDAVQHFPELAKLQPILTLNRERAYQIDPERDFGVSRARFCKPKWLILLERTETSQFDLAQVPGEEAEARLRSDLLAQSAEVMVSQMATVKRLVQPGCWRLRYGGKAHLVAAALASFCLSYAKAPESPVAVQ